MSEMRTSKNYHAHGGEEWVVGGKLTEGYKAGK